MNRFSYEQLAALVGRFDIVASVKEIRPFGSGHINDTFRVLTTASDGTEYLLQRLNHHVFRDVDAVMQNIALVTHHLRQRYLNNMGDAYNAGIKVMTLIPTKEGRLYHLDENGDCWRIFVFLTGTRSYDVVQTPDQAREGGRAFGEFQRLLADLDPRLIREVLPAFHHIGRRLENLSRAVDEDPIQRVSSVGAELDFIRLREQRMRTILSLADAGRLPIRVTHNDTKFNNVLLDEHDRAQCVIDLDTVMPGYVAYDFGDAIRTIISSAPEDEPDLDKIRLSIDLFEAYTEGYLSEMHSILTEDELETLVEGVLLLPYMQGVRFLTDFLEGDHYYKTTHPEHNLQRTRSQLRLVEQLEAHEQELRKIVADVAARYRSVAEQGRTGLS